MPAQSPTLSPTLSAITAGLRGSSSGMPASTLPTRSAPTSAPLVKMPPPKRAKIEISEPPNARPTRALQDVFARRAHGVEDEVVTGHAEQAQAHDQHPGDGAAAERQRQRGVEAQRGGLGRADVGADRDEHADVAGQAREHGADEEADGRRPVQREAEDRRTARRRRWRSSCTDGSCRRSRPPGSRSRSPACAHCRPVGPTPSAP